MVRVYLSESDHGLERVLKCLHDAGVSGVTVMRGIAGFGASGVMHSASLLDLSADLPIIIEFFDLPDKADAAIERIRGLVDPGHIISLPVIVEGGNL